MRPLTIKDYNEESLRARVKDMTAPDRGWILDKEGKFFDNIRMVYWAQLKRKEVQ